jgi:hypothetical protein
MCPFIHEDKKEPVSETSINWLVPSINIITPVNLEAIQTHKLLLVAKYTLDASTVHNFM